jgi:ribonuclease P protein component
VPGGPCSSGGGHAAESACPHRQPVTSDTPFPPSRRGRLSRAGEFDAVAQLGRAVGGRYLTLRYRSREDEGEARVGYAVPRRVGGSVDRNGVKRRLREAIAREEGLLHGGTDYVLIARPGIAATVEAQGFDWLCEQVADLLRSAEAAR